MYNHANFANQDKIVVGGGITPLIAAGFTNVAEGIYISTLVYEREMY